MGDRKCPNFKTSLSKKRKIIPQQEITQVPDWMSFQ